MDNEKNYEVPALIVTPDKAPVITGNYEIIESVLIQWRDKVTSMVLTEDNLGDVVAIKRAAVAVRNRLKDSIDETKRRLFNDPKAIFEARVRQLTDLVADVENCADSVLSRLEQRRVEEINQVLNYYKEELQKEFNLGDDYLARIEFKKDFYNKTTPKGYSSMDKYWKESLKAQFIEQEREQKAYVGNVRLITNSCKGEERLNPELFVEKLKYSDIASVLESIEMEKERLGNVQESRPIKLGIPCSINLKTDFPGRNKTIDVQIDYPCDLGDSLTDLFKELSKYGIKVKKLKKEKEVIF